MSNNISALNAKPLKCILTNNKKSISLLSNTGSLIVYEPSVQNEDNYHELYLANKFLAGGYGLKSEKERDNLSYISNSYLNIIGDLRNYDDELSKRLSYTCEYLTSKKVDIDRGNVSNTLTYFNDDIAEQIYVKDLIKIITNFPVYKNLEISSVDYLISIKNYNGDPFKNEPNSNIVKVPIGTTISSIGFVVRGNTRNSGGIKSINMQLFDDSRISIKESSILGSFQKDTSFIINFSKYYTDSDVSPIVRAGKQTIIDSSIISVNKTPDHEYLSIDYDIVKTYLNHPIIIKSGAIKDNDIILDPLIIEGVYPIYYSFNSGNEIDDNANMQLMNFMNPEDNLDNNSINKIYINKNDVNSINVYIPLGYKIINAEYYNIEKGTIINISNYYNTIEHIFDMNNYEYHLYKWHIDNSVQNEFPISIINKDNSCFFKGILSLNIILANNVNEFNDDYLSLNWVSENEFKKIYIKD